MTFISFKFISIEGFNLDSEQHANKGLTRDCLDRCLLAYLVLAGLGTAVFGTAFPISCYSDFYEMVYFIC